MFVVGFVPRDVLPILEEWHDCTGTDRHPLGNDSARSISAAALREFRPMTVADHG
jgi:hypothetical protein